MSLCRRPMRYSHTEGHTDLCYSEDGKYIITCGKDGDIRVWLGLEDDDPNSQCVSDEAYAVAFKNNVLFVGTEDNFRIQTYKFPDLVKDGVVCGFSAPVTQIVLSKDGKKLVAGSRDMTIKICDKPWSNCDVLSGHSAPILGLSIDPETKYLASSSCDGTIRIWSLDTLKCIHIWSCLPECNSFTNAQCLGRTSWHPSEGKYIAVPNDKNVELYQRSSWEQIRCFSDERIKQPFSITLFSSCGLYLAASTTCGEICIWRLSDKTCISYTEHPQKKVVTAMAWNPTNSGTIAYCDNDGQLGTIEGSLVPTDEQEKGADDSLNITEAKFEDDDEDGENVISLEKIKSSVYQIEDPDIESDVLSLKSLKGVDDDGASEVGGIKFKLQAPFQPSCTPEHLSHRYMVWNSVGLIRCFNSEEENSIDIEFHDSSLHHPIHLNNSLGHTLASLSAKAVVLACGAKEQLPSKIVCILLNSWDGTKEWSVDLPEEEEALAVACSVSWLTVATDVRNLRFFTLAGTQREILSLPGPIVCLAAHENLLLTTCYHGTGLCYVLFGVRSNSIETLVNYQPLPLTPNALLQWAGFSDEGTPCTVDSVGMLRILSPKGYWLPLCNLQLHCKGVSDHYFIIGLNEKYKNIRCILCKGSHYPPTTPRPTVVEIAMKIPVCDAAGERGILEEDFLRNKVILNALDYQQKIDSNRERDEAEKTIKATIMKLFALACRNGLEQRALELCKMMPSSEVVQLALKYSSKIGKVQLAERISQISNTVEADSDDNFNRFSSYRDMGSKKVADGADDKNEDPDPFASQEIAARRESMLLSAKKESTVITPTFPRKNPFKKPSKDNEISADGGVTRGKGSNLSAVPTQAKISSSITKTKQMGLWGKSPNQDVPTTKRPTFIVWYSSERKESLQEEFPDLDSTELTRLAMKRFKEENMMLQKQNSETKINGNVQSTLATSSIDVESTQNALLDDSFALEFSQDSLADAAGAITNPDSQNSTDSFCASKKRKAHHEDDSRSKLTKFAFKK